MFEKISTAGLSNMEWLKLRKQGIGGSDAGAICGLNPYSSPMKVFWDKTTDEVEEQDNEAVRIGHDLEQYVAERFMEATGLKVRRSNYMYRSKAHPYMIADVDRLVIGEDAGLECKTASAYTADKWVDGNIPLHYAMQCYHYMAVTGKRTWYIAAVILGREFVYHKLTWDDALIQRLIEVEGEFWNNHVMVNIIPDPDGSKICDSVLEQYFHTAKKASMIELVGLMTSWHAGRRFLHILRNCSRSRNRLSRKSNCLCRIMSWRQTSIIRYRGAMWIPQGLTRSASNRSSRKSMRIMQR